jgi:hypothetical protein
VILRHASPVRNRPSITRKGILRSYAVGKRKCVWLHPPGKSLWAIEHVAKRHACAPHAVDVYYVDVTAASAAGTLKRGPHGTYYLMGDVEPEQLGRVLTAHDVLMGESGGILEGAVG